LAGGVIALGADAVVLKPALPDAVVASLGDTPAHAAGEVERSRELIRISILGGDLSDALGTLARRVAQVFRAPDCVVVGQVGERRLTATAGGGLPPEPVERCGAAIDAGVPTFASVGDEVVSLCGTQLAPPGGASLGFVVLVNGGYGPEVVDSLRALATRLHSELAWRSVHERI